MKTVHKFVRNPWSEDVLMPLGAEILSVGFQQDNFCMWAMVDTDAVVLPRKFKVFGTGHEIPVELTDQMKFVGTGHMDNGLVFHAFELVNL